jgi:hypothetical protein
MAWWNGDRARYRAELRAGACELAEHRWPVFPGTYRQGGRWIGRDGRPASGFEPVHPDGPARAVRNADEADLRWQRPYSVLVATGLVVDAIEVSALVGRRVCASLRDSGLVVPVAATPTGRWWFAVRAGEPLRPELASRADLRLHSRGSWVAAPPSEGPQGVVHWRVSPAAADWVLPDPCLLQVALLDVLGQRLAPAGPDRAGSVATGVRS